MSCYHVTSDGKLTAEEMRNAARNAAGIRPNLHQPTNKSSAEAMKQRYQQRCPAARKLLCEAHNDTRPRNHFVTAVLDRTKDCSLTGKKTSRDEACAFIKEQWKREGIWDPQWDKSGIPSGDWKSFNTEEVPSTGEGDKSDDIKDPTRPFERFQTHLNMVREDFQNAGHDVPSNTELVTRVRMAWKYWNIWNQNWGSMPGYGAKWNHEIPLEEWLKDCMGPRYISGADVANLGSSPQSPCGWSMDRFAYVRPDYHCEPQFGMDAITMKWVICRKRAAYGKPEGVSLFGSPDSPYVFNRMHAGSYGGQSLFELCGGLADKEKAKSPSNPCQESSQAGDKPASAASSRTCSGDVPGPAESPSTNPAPKTSQTCRDNRAGYISANEVKREIDRHALSRQKFAQQEQCHRKYREVQQVIARKAPGSAGQKILRNAAQKLQDTLARIDAQYRIELTTPSPSNPGSTHGTGRRYLPDHGRQFRHDMERLKGIIDRGTPNAAPTHAGNTIPLQLSDIFPNGMPGTIDTARRAYMLQQHEQYQMDRRRLQPTMDELKAARGAFLQRQAANSFLGGTQPPLNGQTGNPNSVQPAPMNTASTTVFQCGAPESKQTDSRQGTSDPDVLRLPPRTRFMHWYNVKMNQGQPPSAGTTSPAPVQHSDLDSIIRKTCLPKTDSRDPTERESSVLCCHCKAGVTHRARSSQIDTPDATAPAAAQVPDAASPTGQKSPGKSGKTGKTSKTSGTSKDKETSRNRVSKKTLRQLQNCVGRLDSVAERMERVRIRPVEAGTVRMTTVYIGGGPATVQIGGDIDRTTAKSVTLDRQGIALTWSRDAQDSGRLNMRITVSPPQASDEQKEGATFEKGTAEETADGKDITDEKSTTDEASTADDQGTTDEGTAREKNTTGQTGITDEKGTTDGKDTADEASTADEEPTDDMDTDAEPEPTEDWDMVQRADE